MTVLAHGKLCLAGSYALHRHLREQGQAGKWAPTDIDIFYCSSGSGLDRDELRRRLSLMARRCQLQMMGVADAQDVVDESQSMCAYDDFSKRPFAPCLDDKNEADVAAFAREALMSLCSTEPARRRQCARSRCARTRARHWRDALRSRAHPSSSRRLGRYRVRSSIKLVHPATLDDWPPMFNLVDVEPSTLAHGPIALLLGRSTPAALFADFIIREFDIAPCQVAYYCSGDGSRLLPVVSDAARDAIRNDELRLTGCAFQRDDVMGTSSQLGRICKYVDRGFRLPPRPLTAAPRDLLDAPGSTNLRALVWRLLKETFLGCEPVTPPRTAAPAHRPSFPLLLKFTKTDAGAWRVAAPRSSVAKQSASAKQSRDCKLPKHAEALSVWAFVKKLKAEVYRTKADTRACVPQYNGWRVLGQLRRSGKGIDRFDLYLWPPDVLPSLPLRALRPTNRAVRSFRALHALLLQRFATTALGGVVAVGSARSSGRCPVCCSLPCCHRASASVGRAAPPLPPKKRYRAWQRAGRRASESASDDTAARPPADGGPVEVTGMWENVVRVNGVVREDLETAITRHTRLCEEEREYGRARRLITDETEEPLPMLPCAGDDGSARDAPLARLGGATPSAAQIAAVDWLDAHREQLAPVSRELVPSLGYIGSLDLRVQRGERLHELRAEELSARGPYWLGFEGASMAVRVEFLRVAMRGWGFPDDFVAAQVRELVGLSLPGGRLHERDMLVVACGDALSVAQTHPAEFAHSIVLRAFRRTAPTAHGAAVQATASAPSGEAGGG